MKNRIRQRATKLLAWVFAIGAGVFFLCTWSAPGTCLDLGGSFNYEKWECTDELNKFVDVRFYEFKSFWLFGAALVGACALQWGWRKQSNTPARPAPSENVRTG